MHKTDIWTGVEMKSLAANGAKNQALLGVDENQTDGFLLFLSLFLSL